MDEWVRTHVHLSLVLVVVFIAAALAFLLLWLITAGSHRRSRRDQRAAERARRESELLLREQDGRLRIVRELNDLAVHSVSTIISQADGAAYAGRTDPDAAVRSSTAIAEIARETLANLRRVVTVAEDGSTAAALQPRHDTLFDLLDGIRVVGLEIEVVESGAKFDLREGAELAIFRITEESLTNALTHGGSGTKAKVSLTWTAEGLQLLIDDDGARTHSRNRGLDPDEAAQQRPYTIDDDLNALTEVYTGAGITEMRERAAIYGGILNVFSTPGLGFSVSAIFPALRYNNGVHGVNLSEQSTPSGD